VEDDKAVHNQQSLEGKKKQDIGKSLSKMKYWKCITHHDRYFFNALEYQMLYIQAEVRR